MLVERTEQQVFDELAELCQSPGYAHVVAFFCYRDMVVGFLDALKAKDYAKLFSKNRLIRTEVSTLIGLMVRSPRDLTIPPIKTLEIYIQRTEELLSEMHLIFNKPFKKIFENSKFDKNLNPFTSAEVLRESIFYCAESAYSFQYTEISTEKYLADEEWLKKNKGFTPEEAKAIANAIVSVQEKKLDQHLRRCKNRSPESWSFLEGFQFTIDDIVEKSKLSESTVKAVINSFTYQENGNTTFKTVSDFNAVNGFPIIKENENKYVLFLYNSFAEAIYDTPFYWMSIDDEYKDTFSDNRGKFTEQFVRKRLAKVFGSNQVFTNVDIWQSKSKKTKLGEIDVLIFFGSYAIIIQAKSKKLKILSRKGNDNSLKDDFKKAIQDGSDQAFICAKILTEGKFYILESNGTEIEKPLKIEKCHPICVISDHYPSLSFQALQFLNFEENDKIYPPLVWDIFFIDVITEFIESPLLFINYIESRARSLKSVLLSHEISALGYYFNRDLTLDENVHLAIDDDMSVEIDVAMAARRGGIPGKRTPAGLLPLVNGKVAKIISQIGDTPETTAIATGFALLKLSRESTQILNRMIQKVSNLCTRDGKPREFTIGFEKAENLIVVHCSTLPEDAARASLERLCKMQKYRERVDTCFGLALSPKRGELRFCIELSYSWAEDETMQQAIIQTNPRKRQKPINGSLSERRTQRVGRNAPCPCGSGLKYKKCHQLK